MSIPLREGSQNQLFSYVINWYYIEIVPVQYYTFNMLYYTCAKVHVGIALKSKSLDSFSTGKTTVNLFTILLLFPVK